MIRISAIFRAVSAVIAAVLLIASASAVPTIPPAPTPLPKPSDLGGTGSRPTLDLNLSNSRGNSSEFPAAEQLAIFEYDPNDQFSDPDDPDYYLEWTLSAPGFTVKRQEIHRRVGPGSWLNIATVSATARSYHAPKPPRNENYRFRIVAVYDDGPGETHRASEPVLFHQTLDPVMRWRSRENKPYSICGFTPFTPTQTDPNENPCAGNVRYSKKTLTQQVDGNEESGSKYYELSGEPPTRSAVYSQKYVSSSTEKITTTENYQSDQIIDGEATCSLICQGEKTFTLDFDSEIVARGIVTETVESNRSLSSQMESNCNWSKVTGFWTVYIDGDLLFTETEDLSWESAGGSITYDEPKITSTRTRQQISKSYTLDAPNSGDSWETWNKKKYTFSATTELSNPVEFAPNRAFSDSEMKPWCDYYWPEELNPFSTACAGHSSAYRHRGEPPFFLDKCSLEVNIRESEVYYLFAEDTIPVDIRWAIRYTPDVDHEGNPVAAPALDYGVWRSTSSRSETISLLGAGLGSYQITEFTAGLGVADFRGAVSRSEQEHATFQDHRGLGMTAPDPAAATILVADDQPALSPVTLTLHTDIPVLEGDAGEKIEVTLRWQSTKHKLFAYLRTSSEPDAPFDTEPTEIFSPYTCKAKDIGSSLTVIAAHIPTLGQRAYVGKISLELDNGSGNQITDEAYVHVYRVDGPPATPSASERIGFSELTGNRYRKIGLNGRPLSDERPQAQEETDGLPEESYIDALNLNLVHSTTDIHVPVPGSELALSVRRNAESEIWTLQSGLRPHERLNLPFGPAWSTNVASYIEFIDPLGTAIDGGLNPTEALVHDESGSTHRFVKYTKNGVTRWVPFATARHDGRVFLTSLELTGGLWVFTQKYGKTHYFVPGDNITGIGVRGTITYTPLPSDRAYGSTGFHVYSYARLDRVTDRLGYALRYDYAGPETLIPEKIQATLPNGSILAGLQLYIRQIDNQRITRIWSPMGHAVDYAYTTASAPGLPSNNQSQPLHQLTQVEVLSRGGATESSTRYSYATASESSLVPEPPEADKTLPTFHHDLASITDGAGNRWGFGRTFDHTTSLYVENSYVTGYYPQTGRPRWVTVVEPPTGPKINFQNSSSINVQYIPGQTDEVVGQRQTSVTDGVGGVTTYDFNETTAVTLTVFRDLLFGRINPADKFYDPRIIYHTVMTITHGDLGSEVFTFLPQAGLALSSVLDFSGNETKFYYTDAIAPLPAWLADVYPAETDLFQYYDDVTKQVNALNGERLFTYGPKRQMASITDEAGRKTVYTFDPLERRTDEQVFPTPTSTSPVRHVISEYADPIHLGFVTRSVVKKLSLSNEPSWSADLVTNYAPDTLGRVATETTYPVINADEPALPVDPLPTAYTYDFHQNRRSVTDPRGKITVFDYDGFNRLVRTTWHNDDYLERDHDLAGNLLFQKTVGATGTVRHEKYRYDAFRRRTHTEIAKNANAGSGWLVTQSKYSPVGAVLEIIDPRGGRTVHTYDKLQRLETTKDAAGNLTRFYYERSANPGSGAFSSSGFKPTRIIDVRGYLSTFTYDKLYRLSTQKAEYAPGLSATTSHLYDAVGNLTDRIDSLNVLTKTTYDELNRPTQVVAAHGTSEAITTSTDYTSTGLAWRATDGRGNSTETHYDRAGRPIKTLYPSTSAGQAIVRTYYDSSGNVSAIKDALDHVTEFTYDHRNRLLSNSLPSVLDAAADPVAPPVSPTTTINSYRADGLQDSVTDPRGYTTSYAYDGLGRLTTTSHPTDSAAPPAYDFGQTSVEYDANGNPTQIIDPEGKVTINTYDALGRLLSTTEDDDVADTDAITVSNTYDAAGNRLSVTDGRGHVTTFAYDGFSRLTRETDPLGASRVFVYNAINKTSQRDFMGRVTHYLYDKHHRITDVLPAGASAENLRQAYDDNGNLLSATYPNQDGATNVTYTYDARNQRSTEVSSGATHTYDYDLAGRRIGLTTTDDATLFVEYRYDDANRLEKVVQGGGTGPATTYGYDLSGNARLLTLPNGEKTRTLHDALNRAFERHVYAPGAAPTASPVVSTLTTLDKVGNVTLITETYADDRLPGRTITNSYDEIYRLKKETIVTAAHGTASAKTVITDYKYDKAHNRTERKVQATGQAIRTEIYTYNKLNQLNQLFLAGTGGATTTYTYDANGSRVKRVVQTSGTPTPAPVVTSYHYDRADRLVQVVEQAAEKLVDIIPAGHPSRAITARYYVGGDVHSYRYDHRTRRVSRRDADDAAPTRLTFAGGVSVAEYPAASGTPDVRYVRGADIGGGVGGNLYSLRGGSALYSHYNSRGDVVARTDATGAVAYAAAYEAFGTTPEETGENPDRFAANSKEKDPTGLLNEGFRYRDLDTGTFLTRDPLGFVDGPNMYTYVVQNPWSKFDPHGLNAVTEFASAFADEYLGIGERINAASAEIGYTLADMAIMASEIGFSGQGDIDMSRPAFSQTFSGGPDPTISVGGVDFSATAVLSTAKATATVGTLGAYNAVAGGVNMIQGDFQGAQDQFVTSVLAGAGGVRSTEIKIGGPSAADQALINEVVLARVARVQSGTETGNATFAAGRGANGKLTGVSESIPGGAHAEMQVQPKMSGTGQNTIVVDQYPCLGCQANIRTGTRVIVPRNPASPMQGPKTAAQKAAYGKAAVVPKVLPRGSTLKAPPPPSEETQ